jgi:hypothetical protein
LSGGNLPDADALLHRPAGYAFRAREKEGVVTGVALPAATPERRPLVVAVPGRLDAAYVLWHQWVNRPPFTAIAGRARAAWPNAKGTVTSEVHAAWREPPVERTVLVQTRRAPHQSDAATHLAHLTALRSIVERRLVVCTGHGAQAWAAAVFQGAEASGPGPLIVAGEGAERLSDAYDALHRCRWSVRREVRPSGDVGGSVVLGPRATDLRPADVIVVDARCLGRGTAERLWPASKHRRLEEVESVTRGGPPLVIHVETDHDSTLSLLNQHAADHKLSAHLFWSERVPDEKMSTWLSVAYTPAL